MKPDVYAKAILTVIAFLLLLIACNQYASPAATASAQGPFAGVQVGGSDGLTFFDTRSGEVWQYSHNGVTGGHPAQLFWKFRIAKLGQPLVNETPVK
jgi:hypothetical protein